MDELFFISTDQYNIAEVFEELEDSYISFTFENNVYALFVVEVKTDKQSGKVTLNQGWLTNKVMNKVVILDSNRQGPA